MARVAVNPWRKALPPTGPISPPQKKPARASVRSISVATRASWSGSANIFVPRPLQVKSSAPAGLADRGRVGERLPEICVRRGGIADEEAQRLADPDRLAE